MTSLTYSPDFRSFSHEVNGTELYNVIFLRKHSKIPISSEAEWTRRSFEKRLKTLAECESAISRGLNMGYPPQEGEFVLDVDRKNMGIESFERLCNDLGQGESLHQTVQTASGGAHCYFRYAERGLTFSGNLARYGYPGIDIISKGRYVVIPGCIVVDKGKQGAYAWLDDRKGQDRWSQAAEWIINAVRRRSNIRTPEVWNEDIENLAPSVEMGLRGGELSLRDLRELLAMLDPDIDYDSWLRVLMGVHTSFEGSTLARDALIDWSAGGKKFKAGEIEKKWESFELRYLFGENGSRDQPESVTIGTVIWMAKEEAKIQEASKALDLRDRIRGANLADIRIRTQLERDVQLWKGEERYRESFVQAFSAQLKKLNIPESIRGLRELLKVDEQTAKNRTKRLADLFTKHTEGWIFRASTNKFLFTKNRQQAFELTSFGFDCHFSALLGDRGPASRYLTGLNPTKQVYVPTVKTEQYSFAQPLVFETNGELILNLCPIDEIVRAANILRPGSQAIMDKFVATQKDIWGEEANILLDFVCCQFKNPDLKLPWAMVLIGPPGIGKSMWIEMFQRCFGYSNIGTPQPHQIQKSFDSIFLPQKLIIFDEFSVPGHKEETVMAKLRQAITQSNLTLELKGKDLRKYRNPSNFMFFSNSLNSLLTSIDDRRICPLQSKWSNIYELCDHLGTTSMGHWYDDFFELIRTRPEEVVRYWEDLELSPNASLYLTAGSHAPVTSFKADMVQDSIDKVKGLLDVLELLAIEIGFHPLLTKDWVCSQVIFDDSRFSNDNYFDSPGTRRQLLALAGFSHRVRFDTSIRGATGRKEPCYYLYLNQGGEKTRYSFYSRSVASKGMIEEIRTILKTYQTPLAKTLNVDGPAGLDDLDDL